MWRSATARQPTDEGDKRADALEDGRSQFRVVDRNVELLFERRHKPEGIDGVQAETLAIQARLRPNGAEVR